VGAARTRASMVCGLRRGLRASNGRASSLFPIRACLRRTALLLRLRASCSAPSSRPNLPSRTTRRRCDVRAACPFLQTQHSLVAGACAAHANEHTLPAIAPLHRATATSATQSHSIISQTDVHGRSGAWSPAGSPARGAARRPPRPRTGWSCACISSSRPSA